MMAEHKRAIFAAEVHASTFAVAEEFAVVARCEFTHPLAVAVGLKAILPYLPKVIVVDIALVVLATHTCASRYAAVDEDRRYTHARSAMEEVVAHFQFIIWHKALAGVRDMQSLFALLADIIQHIAVLLGCE